MGERVTPLRIDQATLAERLSATRARLFVGRETEISTYEHFVAPGSPLALWFVVGSGGVGKSALLRQLHTRAITQGLAAVWVDARHIAPNPPAARTALARAAESHEFAAFCTQRERPLLFIDTFEYWQALEPWLFDEFLPTLPASLKVIIGSRVPPSLEWRADEGWRALMEITELAPLAAAECTEYLRRRAVAPDRQMSLVNFSGGHPLALAMGADAMLAGYTLDATRGDADTTLIGTLVENFTQEARSDDQRRALDACAVVREINEPLLAALLGREDVSALYAWLQGLAFMEFGRHGCWPHDLVREVLMQDMPRRSPGRYEVFARAVFDWTVDRIEAAGTLSWSQSARWAADAMYALRALPVVQHFLQPSGSQGLYLDRARGDDHVALTDMVIEHEGEASAYWFEFWRSRCPNSVYVVRDVHEAPRGFFVKLDMENLAPEAREADPLTRHLWQVLSGDFGLRPGEHAPFIRFWMGSQHGQSQSPEKTQILMAISAYNLMAGNLRMTAQVFADNPEWVEQARALGISLLADSETMIGERHWRIYYNDWQRESPTHYYRRFAQRCIGFQDALGGDTPDCGSERLSEADFRAAVDQALKNWDRQALRGSSLLASALVSGHIESDADQSTRVDTLMSQVIAATERIGAADERGWQWQRVLDRAYLAPARNQREAAEALNMGYSTFRRQLANARRALADELWRQEQAAR